MSWTFPTAIELVLDAFAFCCRKGDWLTIPKGWLCYLAPEVIRSLRADQNQENEELDFTTATDVFAFG